MAQEAGDMRTRIGKPRPAGLRPYARRLALLLAGTALLASLPVETARAHSIHADCRVGRSWMGAGPHYHPGGYGRAVRCNPRQRGNAEQPPSPTGRKYYEIEPPRSGQR